MSVLAERKIGDNIMPTSIVKKDNIKEIKTFLATKGLVDYEFLKIKVCGCLKLSFFTLNRV